MKLEQDKGELRLCNQEDVRASDRLVVMSRFFEENITLIDSTPQKLKWVL